MQCQMCIKNKLKVLILAVTIFYVVKITWVTFVDIVANTLDESYCKEWTGCKLKYNKDLSKTKHKKFEQMFSAYTVYSFTITLVLSLSWQPLQKCL